MLQRLQALLDDLVHLGEGLQMLLDVPVDGEEFPVVLHQGLHEGLLRLLPLIVACGDRAAAGWVRTESPALTRPPQRRRQ